MTEKERTVEEFWGATPLWFQLVIGILVSFATLGVMLIFMGWI